MIEIAGIAYREGQHGFKRMYRLIKKCIQLEDDAGDIDKVDEFLKEEQMDFFKVD